MGTAKKRADIVIFSENGEHTQGNIYMIVEVKTEDVKPSDEKEGSGQLESYVAASLNYIPPCITFKHQTFDEGRIHWIIISESVVFGMDLLSRINLRMRFWLQVYRCSHCR